MLTPDIREKPRKADLLNQMGPWCPSEAEAHISHLGGCNASPRDLKCSPNAKPAGDILDNSAWSTASASGK